MICNIGLSKLNNTGVKKMNKNQEKQNEKAREATHVITYDKDKLAEKLEEEHLFSIFISGCIIALGGVGIAKYLSELRNNPSIIDLLVGSLIILIIICAGVMLTCWVGAFKKEGDLVRFFKKKFITKFRQFKHEVLILRQKNLILKQEIACGSAKTSIEILHKIEGDIQRLNKEGELFVNNTEEWLQYHTSINPNAWETLIAEKIIIEIQRRNKTLQQIIKNTGAADSLAKCEELKTGYTQLIEAEENTRLFAKTGTRIQAALASIIFELQSLAIKKWALEIQEQMQTYQQIIQVHQYHDYARQHTELKNCIDSLRAYAIKHGISLVDCNMNGLEAALDDNKRIIESDIGAIVIVDTTICELLESFKKRIEIKNVNDAYQLSQDIEEELDNLRHNIFNFSKIRAHYQGEYQNLKDQLLSNMEVAQFWETLRHNNEIERLQKAIEDAEERAAVAMEEQAEAARETAAAAKNTLKVAIQQNAMTQDLMHKVNSLKNVEVAHTVVDSINAWNTRKIRKNLEKKR